MSTPNAEQATENEQRRMKGDDIARRLLRFAVGVLELVRGLRRDSVGRHIGRQLMRSATAGGSNYEEARSAESRGDFAHKVSIAAKELRESLYWLNLISEANLTSTKPANELMREGSELVAILTASVKTARGLARKAKERIENREQKIGM